MKFYFYETATNCKGLWLYLLDNDIPFEPVSIDLMKGEHLGEAYKKIHPNQKVPAIEDNGFVLTETGAILVYLAQKHELPSYPREPAARARVHEALSFAQTELCRDLHEQMFCPQLLEHYKRRSEEGTQATIMWGAQKAARLLSLLDEHYLNRGGPFMCGDSLTLADYYLWGVLTTPLWAGVDYKAFPHIDRFLDEMSRRPGYEKVFAPTRAMIDLFKDKKFVTWQDA